MSCAPTTNYRLRKVCTGARRAPFWLSMPDLSVIIPTCSDQVPLKECLRSLIRQTIAPERYEILVVNNGGMDHAERFIQPILAELHSPVSLRVFNAGKNLGYGGGCRLGVLHSGGEILVFHNDDSVADPTWLALAAQEFRETPDLGVVTCRVVSLREPVLQHEGSILTHPHGLFWQVGYGLPDYPILFRNEIPPPLSRLERGAGGEVPRQSISVELDFFSGCIWATPRRVWDKIGGLAPCYFPGYYEDSEYALRCRREGYRIRLLRTVTCGHVMNATLGGTSAHFWRIFHRSRYLFLLRNRLPHSWYEIITSELQWWREHRAGHNPWDCFRGLIAAFGGFLRRA